MRKTGALIGIGAFLAAWLTFASAQIIIQNWPGTNNFQGPIGVAIRSPTTSPITVSGTTDYFICVKAAGAVTVNLPASQPAGRTYLIKDCLGTGGPIAITPSGANVDGTSSFSMSTAYGSVAVTSDGTNWFLN